MPDDLSSILQKAVDGLEYPSESDGEFDVISWPAAAGANVLAAVKSQTKAKAVEQVPLDTFFSELAGTTDSARFAQLRETLEQNLKNLAIFRIPGKDASFDIYLVGQSPDGNWAGVHTTSVET